MKNGLGLAAVCSYGLIRNSQNWRAIGRVSWRWPSDVPQKRVRVAPSPVLCEFPASKAPKNEAAKVHLMAVRYRPPSAHSAPSLCPLDLPAKAANSYRQAPDILPSDPETIRAVYFNAVACNLTEAGDYMARWPLLRQALEIQEKLLGPKHPVR